MVLWIVEMVEEKLCMQVVENQSQTWHKPKAHVQDKVNSLNEDKHSHKGGDGWKP